MQPVKLGIVGCGYISDIYLQNCAHFDLLEVVACADLMPERAAAQAAKYGVPKACSVEQLLADPEVELVVNLTIPAAHAAVALATVAASKSVYNEKPLAVAREDGKQLLDSARARGVLLGGAPDTFLGAGYQTCRALIDDGVIGEPVAATAFMFTPGHERWHPNPDFYYQPGGGPMFDMGPYYLTALISLLGPVRRVTGSARASYPERTITSEPRHGENIPVQVPTHVATVLDFASGPIATLVTSFDVWAGQVPRIEVYGSTGSLSAPDPNTFGGPVRLLRAGSDTWEDIPLNHGHTDNSRGLGVDDMAKALRSGVPPRASGDLAFHVLDIIHASLTAANEGRHISLTSTCARPAPLASQLPPLTERPNNVTR